MATIKLKYNPSAREGKEGVLFFQIIHQRQVKRIYPNITKKIISLQSVLLKITIFVLK